MTTVRASLEAGGRKRMLVELQAGEQVTLGYAPQLTGRPLEGSSEEPDYDLAEIATPDRLAGVAPRHAVLTYVNGDFRIATVDEQRTFIGQYIVTPGRFFRLVGGDRLRFGEAEFTFYIEKLDESPSPVTSASVADGDVA